MKHLLLFICLLQGSILFAQDILQKDNSYLLNAQLNSQNAKMDSITMMLDSLNRSIKQRLCQECEELRIKDRIRKLRERVQLGISFGFGRIENKDNNSFVSPSIDPVDSILLLQPLDRNVLVLSASVVVTPFLHSDWIADQRLPKDPSNGLDKFKNAGLWLLENSGFGLNINLLQISTDVNQPTLAPSLGGGLNYSLRLSPNIYFGVGKEVMFQRVLKESFAEGEPIYLEGQKIASINQIEGQGDEYFFTKAFSYWTTRVTISF